MQVIYKYDISDSIVGMGIRLEANAKVLSVKEQNGRLTVWVLQETTAPQDTQFYFRTYGTGWEMTNINLTKHNYKFVDTVLMSDGLVWHVFCSIMPGYYNR